MTVDVLGVFTIICTSKKWFKKFIKLLKDATFRALQNGEYNFGIKDTRVSQN